MDKKVSIIVPAYNSERTISRCIDSLLFQTYSNIEIIIINDGSVDNTIDICNDYIKNYENIKFISKENGGVSSARNVGLDISTGDYICFVDADDTIEKEAIKSLVNLITQADADLGVCNVRVINEFDKKQDKFELFDLTKLLIDKITYEEQEFHSNVSLYKGYLCNKIFKSCIAKKIRLNEKIHYCEDELFLKDYVKLASKVVYTSWPLYNYYVADKNASSWDTWNEKKITIIDAREIIIDYLQKYDFSVYKDYYMSYFLSLNDIYHRFDKADEYRKKLKTCYKKIIGYYGYTFKDKLKVFIKYKFYLLYRLFVIIKKI